MQVEIVPAVLATNLATFKSRQRIAEGLGTTIHIDLMDGKFVDSKSISPDTLAQIKFQSKIGIHLMVNQPENWIKVILIHRPAVVVLPVEIGVNLKPMIALLRANKIKTFLSINPSTSITKLKPIIKFVQGIQVMMIKPGRYGATFQSAMLKRIKLLKKSYPRYLISCDGGMNPETAPLAIKAGATVIIVGSYIVKSKNPITAYRLMKNASKSSS